MVNAGNVCARVSTNQPMRAPPATSAAIVVPRRIRRHGPGGSLFDMLGLSQAVIPRAVIAQQQLLVVSGAGSRARVGVGPVGPCATYRGTKHRSPGCRGLPQTLSHTGTTP